MGDFKFICIIICVQYFCNITAGSDYENSENVQELVTEDNETNTNDSSPLIVKKSHDNLSDTTEDTETVEPKKSSNTSALCPQFIYSAGFNMEKMSDVWLPVYYKMPEKLKCFKILISKTSKEELKQYEEWYGNFNGSIDWKECRFEVRSGEVKDRKHFLQGGVGDMGVMRNIVLLPDDNGNYGLHEETPDQWLMAKELMLLRDCQTGGMVVFSRVPHRPKKDDILEALNELGEDMVGEMLCEDPQQ